MCIRDRLQAIPGVVCECPKGAFYVMAALPVDDADAFQRWLLEEFQDNGDTVMFAPVSYTHLSLTFSYPPFLM